MEPATLERLFRRAIKTCHFFPKVSDVLQPIEDSPIAQAEAEAKWTRVLEYIRLFWSPDLPGGVSRGAPRVTERTMTAIRAAGGFAWLNECPRDDLQWCKKRFVESYTAWATLRRDEYLLPEDSPVKALLSEANRALPAPRDNWSELRVVGLAHAETLRASDDLPETRAPHAIAASPERRAELARQAEEMVVKFSAKARGTAQ